MSDTLSSQTSPMQQSNQPASKLWRHSIWIIYSSRLVRIIFNIKKWRMLTIISQKIPCKNKIECMIYDSIMAAVHFVYKNSKFAIIVGTFYMHV